MPPKSKKQLNAAKSKIVEDKTFGLKNKNKSKKMQQYVNQVKQQAEDIGRDRKSAVCPVIILLETRGGP